MLLDSILRQLVEHPKRGWIVITATFVIGVVFTWPAADNFTLDTLCTPCSHNPLGAKGCGEAGAIGSPPAVINAVLDALKPLGVIDFDMPASPSRVWEAIQSAKH